MKSFTVLFALVALVLALAGSVSARRLHNVDEVQFHKFKTTHGRNYPSKAHEQYRFKIFKQNLKKIAELNQANPSAKYDVNHFADIHPREFKQRYLNYRPTFGDDAVKREKVPTLNQLASNELPTSFDWRKPSDGRPVAVTAVKDQGQCGSCWAFSTVETVESAYILAGNKPVSMAPQQLVDCDVNNGDQGCNGGMPSQAYVYVEASGLEAETNYPYFSGTTGAAGNCTYNPDNVVTKLSSWAYATPSCDDACTNQNEALLAQNLYANGPVSIAVDASQWQFYSSGVVSPSSGCSSAFTSLDHAVQLVGYGVDAGVGKYWSIRNSWNTVWGEAGYIRVTFGTNTCGLADVATQVKI